MPFPRAKHMLASETSIAPNLLGKGTGRATGLRCAANRKLTTIFEGTGSALAMAYALLIASNTGNEILGFALLLISSGLFSAWAVIDRRLAFLVLQFFYAASAVIGLFRWG